MAPSTRTITAAVVTGFLMAAGLVAQGPPQDLHWEDDHWSAWDEPDQIPEGAQTYDVIQGDTLWDLAERYFGDPYLWPQLWERNQYILDAHWIYPGDTLVVSVEVVPVDALADADAETEGIEGMEQGGPLSVEEPIPAPGEDTMLFASEGGAPTPLGNEADIYCSGFIGPEDREFPHTLVGSEAAALGPTIYGANDRRQIRTRYGVVNTLKSGLATSDIIYVDGGRSAGLMAGSSYTMVDPREVVRHPVSGEPVGRFYRYLGRARILSVQEETAIAEIMESCHPAEIGTVLMPFVAEPVPLARRTSMRPINLPASDSVLEQAPAIVHVDHSLVSLGQGNVVFIDRGETDDVVPGDVFTIYRMNTPGLPAVVLGELAVLAVQDTTATAKIISSRYTVRVGDRIDPK